MKELAQLPRLCHADGALPVERFAHVAALAKHRQQQLGGGLAGMLDQELQVFGGGRVIWGHAMPAVVVLNKQKQQPHELGFVWCAGAALADEISGAMPDGFVLLHDSIDRKSTRLNSSHLGISYA